MDQAAGAEAQRAREQGRQEHLAWLQEQRSEYEQHLARPSAGGGSSSGLGDESFFAAEENEMPIYRSLALSAPSQPASAEYVDEEEPVYRSLDLSKFAETLPSPDTSADASWVRSGRPPLLRRQNAFKFKGDQPEWQSMLGQPQDPAQPSGHK